MELDADEQKEINDRIFNTKAKLEKQNLSYQDLLELTAVSMVQEEINVKLLNEHIDEYELLFKQVRQQMEDQSSYLKNTVLPEMHVLNKEYVQAAYKLGIDRQKKFLAKKGASARHKENRSMKDDAIGYYKENHINFKNKDDAAQQIAKKIVPAEFSTVRGWLKNIKPE